jgi:hypothetical protein
MLVTVYRFISYRYTCIGRRSVTYITHIGMIPNLYASMHRFFTCATRILFISWVILCSINCLWLTLSSEWIIPFYYCQSLVKESKEKEIKSMFNFHRSWKQFLYAVNYQGNVKLNYHSVLVWSLLHDRWSNNYCETENMFL